MSSKTWADIAARLSQAQALDVNDLVRPDQPDPPVGGWLAREGGAQRPPPATALWHLRDAGAAFIAVRVSAPLDNVVEVAVRLVAMAAERAVAPVIFSQIPHSGFERFGFRVERLAGASDAERAACEEELKRFWDVAVVIDAADIARLA
jgi:hypothetical protein